MINGPELFASRVKGNEVVGLTRSLANVFIFHSAANETDVKKNIDKVDARIVGICMVTGLIVDFKNGVALEIEIEDGQRVEPQIPLLID